MGRLAFGDLAALGETIAHVLVDLINRASADRIVRMVLQQPFPCDPEVFIGIFAAQKMMRHGTQRFGPMTEQRLTCGIGLLDPYPAGEDSWNQDLLVIRTAKPAGLAEFASHFVVDFSGMKKDLPEILIEVRVNDAEFRGALEGAEQGLRVACIPFVVIGPIKNQHRRDSRAARLLFHKRPCIGRRLGFLELPLRHV